MKNKWRFFAVTLAVVLCMTVFSVTAYAGGDMVDSTMGDPTMESPTATTQPENTNTGEQTPNGQTLTVLVTENADGSHTVTIGDRSWTLPAKREQAGKVVNVRTYLNLRTGPGTDYTVIGRLLNGAEVKVLEESNGWYKVVVPEQTGYVYGKYLDVMNAPTHTTHPADLRERRFAGLFIRPVTGHGFVRGTEPAAQGNALRRPIARASC